jgi:toxin ParE1/3/4
VRRFILSRPAQRDIREIHEYISNDSRAAADRVRASIRETCRRLADYPRSGRLRPSLGSDIRGFPVGSYLIFYREVGDGVHILRIVHGRRDIERAFRE